MANQQETTTTADDEVARIAKAGGPGVESAMKVLEVTEQHYFAAVNQTSQPLVTTTRASHT